MRIICIPENFIELMKETATRDGLSPELAEVIARKMIEMSIPENEYRQALAQSIRKA